MRFLNFRLVKKFWRLILGAAFIGSGISYIEIDPKGAYITLGIGGFFALWHILWLIKEASATKRQK